MVRYDEDDPLGAKTVARPDSSSIGAPPPPVEYVDPFDSAAMEEGKKEQGFGEILGRNWAQVSARMENIYRARK